MLRYLFGDNALVKITDFFLENRFWDYTKTDAAKNAEVSRVQLHRVWPVLEKLEVVKPSRKIGATTLYKANTDSPIFEKLSQLSLELASKTHTPTVEEEERAAVQVRA